MLECSSAKSPLPVGYILLTLRGDEKKKEKNKCFNQLAFQEQPVAERLRRAWVLMTSWLLKQARTLDAACLETSSRTPVGCGPPLAVWQVQFRLAEGNRAQRTRQGLEHAMPCLSGRVQSCRALVAPAPCNRESEPVTIGGELGLCLHPERAVFPLGCHLLRLNMPSVDANGTLGLQFGGFGEQSKSPDNIDRLYLVFVNGGSSYPFCSNHSFESS